MVAVADLSELGALTPELLHVFLAGPGQGEGVAVRLPDGLGWILVDGCCTRPGTEDEALPLERILARWRRRIVEHVGLKVPHHGSREAIHGRLAEKGRAARAWLLTPFNSSSLPRTDDGDGLDELLAAQDPVLLTAPSLSARFQAAFDEGRVSRGELSALTAALRREGLFKTGDTVARAGTATGPLDAIWAAEFDAGGAVRGLWRGPAACLVHERRPAAPVEDTRP